MENEEKSREEILWERAKEFDGVARAESYHELSKIEYDRHNYSEALSMCLVAKELYEKDGANSHTREIIDIYEGLSSIYECLDDCAEAEEALKEAVGIARKEESELLGDLLRSLGRMHYEHKKWEESIEAHSEAMLIPIQENEDRSIGVDYLNVGMAHYRLENYVEALQYEMQALEHFEDEKVAPIWLVHTYGELACTYAGLGNGEKAVFFGQKALDWHEIEKNYSKCWWLMYYIGIGYRLQGELDQALEILKQARDLAVEHADTPQHFLVDVDKEAGEIFLMKGSVEKGQELIRRSKSVQEILEKKPVDKEVSNGKHN